MDLGLVRMTLPDKPCLLYTSNQDEERYLSALKKDIEEFKEKKRTIVSYVPSSSVDVETFTKDGYDWARLYCIYGIKPVSYTHLDVYKRQHHLLFWQMSRPVIWIRPPVWKSWTF